MGGFRDKITVTAVADSDTSQWSEDQRQKLEESTNQQRVINGSANWDLDDYVFSLLEAAIEERVKLFHTEHEGMFYGEPTVHRG